MAADAANVVVMAAAFTALAVATSPSKPSSTECDLVRLDECANRLIPYSEGKPLPVDGVEFKRDCLNAEASVACMRKISNSNCIKSGIASATLKVIVEGVERVSGERCDPEHDRYRDYKKYVPCLNTVRANIHDCILTMNQLMQALQSYPASERIAMSCCAFSRLSHCVRYAAEKKCSAEHHAYMNEMLQTISEEAVSAVCTKYTAEACARVPQVQGGQPVYKTMVPALIEALSV